MHIAHFPGPPASKSPKLLSEQPTIHPTCQIHDSDVGGWTKPGPNTTLAESTFGDYSYTAGNGSIIYADVGKFCSIANSSRINPGNHPQWRVTQHYSTYRRVGLGSGHARRTLS